MSIPHLTKNVHFNIFDQIRNSNDNGNVLKVFNVVHFPLNYFNLP